MPIYEYRCTSCQAELEKLQKISDPPLVECPECGKDTLVKLISASSFRLKGSGWYETDFKTGNKKHGVAEDAAKEGSAKEGSTKEGSAKEGSNSKDGNSLSPDSGTKAAPKETSEGGSKKEPSSKAAKSDSKNGGAPAGAASK